MPKISVIISIYNTEKFLSQCLESVLSQTLKDIEIICINDGSTDNSHAILKKYTQIILIDKENTGAGDSRNRGLEIAKGKYVLFLDSDDFLEPGALKTLYEKASSSDCEVLFFNVYKYFENGQKNFYNFIEPYERKFKEEVFSPLEAKEVLFQVNALPFKMYKRESLLKYGVKYSTHSLVEDQSFFYKIITNSDKICAISNVILNYRIHSESITQKVSNYIGDMFDEFYLCEEIVKNSKYGKEVLPYFIKDRVKAMFYWFENIGKKKKPLFYKNLKIFLKYLRKNYGESIFESCFELKQVKKVIKYPYFIYRFLEKVQLSVKTIATYLN